MYCECGHYDSCSNIRNRGAISYDTYDFLFKKRAFHHLGRQRHQIFAIILKSHLCLGDEIAIEEHDNCYLVERFQRPRSLDVNGR